MERMSEDRLIEYRMGPNFGPTGTCRVRLFRPSTGCNVLVATELPGNHGPSITNAAEQAFASACSKFGVDPLGQGVVWIEHYPGDDLQDDTFDLVCFEGIHAGMPSGPNWRHLKHSEVSLMTGAAIEELAGHPPSGEAAADFRAMIIGEAISEAMADDDKEDPTDE